MKCIKKHYRRIIKMTYTIKRTVAYNAMVMFGCDYLYFKEEQIQ